MNSRYFEKLKTVASVSPDKIDIISKEDLEYMNLRLFTQEDSDVIRFIPKPCLGRMYKI